MKSLFLGLRVILPALVASWAACVAPPAVAGITWTMSGSSDCGSDCVTQAKAGNTRSFTTSGITLKASAWSNTGTVGSSPVAGDPNSGSLQTAYLGLYGGGLGVKNRDGGTSSPNTGDTDEFKSPEHAVDNDQRFDSVLFSFSKNGTADKIALKSITVGYISEDSDISVLAYTKDDTPVLTDKSYSGLIGAGWKVIGTYSDLQLNTAKAINSGDYASANWLVGSFFSGSDPDGKYHKDEHVKILAAYGKEKPPNGVPEPNALLLLGVALAGIAVTRRATHRRPA